MEAPSLETQPIIDTTPPMPMDIQPDITGYAMMLVVFIVFLLPIIANEWVKRVG